MRLIDADALFISKEYCLDEAGFGASYYVVHKSDIDEAPTIEAEPVKHGRWERLEDDWNSLCLIKCSLCREEWCIEVDDDVQLLNYKYCLNCGAKMDLGG